MAGQGPWHGKSKVNLQEAIEDAWEKNKNDLPSGTPLIVDQIFITGENPITEYSVTIKKP
ncbi:MAG TPA: hypothetical protein VFM96_12030 [Gaiellaceae bacterium]|nr:hypothetical protein [Gaiellaceae bacterium]